MSLKKVFNLSNAVVTVTERIKPSRYVLTSYSEYKKRIDSYKKKMETLERGSEKWEYLRAEIHQIRNANQFQDKDFQPKKKKHTIILLEYKVKLKNWSKFEYTYNRDYNNDEHLNRYIWRDIRDFRRDCFHKWRRSLKTAATPHAIGRQLFTMMRDQNGETGVFASPNQILKAHVSKNMKQLFDDKKPTTKNNYIGIEIEFCAPISEEVLAVKLFRTGLYKFVQLKNDGSLRPHKDKNENGFELAMLLREGSYKLHLKKVTKLLTEIKAVAVDRRCGLHVHFDMRNRTKELVYNNLVASQNALWSILDPRRYDSEFCRTVKTRDFPTKFTGERVERYKSINAASYFRHKTLEVRMHEGCTDYESISNWIDILLKIVNYKKKLKTNISKLESLKTKFKLSPKVYKTIVDKSCYWQVNFHEDTRRALERMEDNAAAAAEENVREPARPRRIEPVPITEPIPIPPEEMARVRDALEQIRANREDLEARLEQAEAPAWTIRDDTAVINEFFVDNDTEDDTVER